jgi:uncharacterized protein YbjT (DUF2867 family)
MTTHAAIRIAVLGATGATGDQFIRKALQRGHTITALVRSPQKVTIAHPNLIVQKGDARHIDDLQIVLKDQDAVFCALGNGENLRPTDIRTEGTRAMIRALEGLNTKPYVVILSSLGAGDSQFQIQQPSRIMVRTMLRNVLQDHEAQEALIRASGLPYTIIRPSGLNNASGIGQLSVTQPPEIVNPQVTVSREDIAAFALNLIESRESQDYIGKAVTLSSVRPQSTPYIVNV